MGKAATKPAKVAKVPIGLLRELEKALRQDESNQQIGQVWQRLASESDTRQAEIAGALLEHTKTGSPLARGFLASIADGKSSDAFVRHCAVAPKGRGLLVGPLGRVWKLATDVEALEATFESFSQTFADLPALMELGVEAAARLGGTATEAARRVVLERGRKMAPLVAQLSGGDAERKKARPELSALGREDRRQIYLRVIQEPASFAEDLAIEALDAVLLDPLVGDSALAMAVVGMHYHGEEELVKAWQARVKAGDIALIAKLIQLLDWIGSRAVDDDQLEPLIHGLWPAGNRPEVFAALVRLLQSQNPVAQAAACEEWIRESEGRMVLDNAQIDQVIRIIGAMSGADGNDVERAANSALFYARHPGARTAQMELIRGANLDKTPKLRRNCYFGLGDDDVEVRAFMIERLFEEDREYWSLLDWFEDRTDAAVHRDALAALSARKNDAKAIHAATAYFDAMYDKKKVPRFAIGVARQVLDWTPPTKEDARRLRYIFECATAASLAINDTDAAHAFLAKLEIEPLAVAPYSDYQELDRGQPTTSALADAAVKKQLAALRSGKLDKAIAELRAVGEAARAKGRPIKLDDTQLGLLARCTVSGRLLDDQANKVIWFFDEIGDLQVYDGYAVLPMADTGIEWRRLDPSTPPLELIGAHPGPVEERAVAMGAKVAAFREILRFGRTVLVASATSGANWTGRARVGCIGLRFADAAAAANAVERFAANLPKDYEHGDAWYRAKRGAVSREYSTYGSGEKHGAAVMVVGGEIRGWITGYPDPVRQHASHEAAVAAYELWEAGVYADGGRLHEIGIDKDATIREDTTLAVFLEDRARDDSKDEVWHAKAIGEMVHAIHEAGLSALVPDLVAHAGPPATEAEIAAYQALVPEPLPETLLAVWRGVGGFGFTSSTTTARFSSPKELVQQRAQSRAKLDTWAVANLKGQKLVALQAKLDQYDPIAFVGETPVTLFDTKLEHDDGRCYGGPDSGWWEKSLGWCIATDVASALSSELLRRVGDVHRLRLGQRAGTATVRTRLASGDKMFEAIVDGVQTMTRTMTATKPGKASVKNHASPEAARAFFELSVSAQKKKGWKRV